MCPQDLDSTGRTAEGVISTSLWFATPPFSSFMRLCNQCSYKKNKLIQASSVSSATWDSHILSELWTLTATAMKTHYFLLVMLFFLFSQMEPGAGLLTSLGRRTDQYRCLQHGGFCLRSSCPSNTKLQGTCKPEKPNCCKS